MKFFDKLAELFKDEEPVAATAVPTVVEEKVPELKKRTMKLVENKVQVDIGVTTVKLTFEDKRELLTRIYGEYKKSKISEGQDQFSKYHNMIEPSVGIDILDSSIVCAEYFISNLGKERTKSSIGFDGRFNITITPAQTVFTDDPRKPTVSFVGKVISAQIIKTEQCLEEVTKYSVEPI